MVSHYQGLVGCLVMAEWRQACRSGRCPHHSPRRIFSEANAWFLNEDAVNVVFPQSWCQRRKKNWPSGALFYVRILLQSWVVCPVSQEMIFAYFRPLMVVVRTVVRQSGRSLGAEMTGGGEDLVDRITSSKLHIDKAGGGGVAVATTGTMVGKWSG